MLEKGPATKRDWPCGPGPSSSKTKLEKMLLGAPDEVAYAGANRTSHEGLHVCAAAWPAEAARRAGTRAVGRMGVPRVVLKDSDSPLEIRDQEHRSVVRPGGSYKWHYRSVCLRNSSRCCFQM